MSHHFQLAYLNLNGLYLFFSPFGDGDINLVGNSGANNLHINDVSTHTNIYLPQFLHFDLCAFASGVWWPFPAYVGHDAHERRAGHASDGECKMVAFLLSKPIEERFHVISIQLIHN